MIGDSVCPPVDVLRDVLERNATDLRSLEFRQHVAACPACQARLPKTVVEKLKQTPPVQAEAVRETVSGVDGPSLPGDKRQAELGFLLPPQQPDEIGRLGAYRVLQVLGKGGMGLVLLAHDPALNRRVALKVMLPGIAAHPSARERFLREARVAASLRNDHIVHIYQVSEERGVPFLAMELLEGMPLDAYLQANRQLKPAQVLRIGREIAKGLAAAHEKGLVHRDIKPSNIWLDKMNAGRVKILDFGLARAQDDVHLTQSGAIVGTPAYMAPEQAGGDRNVDGRADLFSMGCVLYRLCTGDMPFKGETTMAVLMALTSHQPAPPAALNRAISPELSDLIMQLLAKEPAGRPASAQDVVARLAAIEKGSLPETRVPTTPTVAYASEVALLRKAEIATSPPSPRIRPGWFARMERKHRVAIAAAGLALLLLAGIVLFWPTPQGIVRIDIDDDDIEVMLTKTGATLKKADKNHDIVVTPAADHRLKIKRGSDFEFETTSFVLRNGETVRLKVQLLKGEVQVVQGKDVLGAKALPAKGRPAPPELARAIREGRVSQPDLGKAKVHFDDKFDNPKSGWEVDNKTYGFAGGKYHIHAPADDSRWASSPGGVHFDFACQVSGRTTVTACQWSFEVADQNVERYVSFKLNGRQELQVHLEGDKVAKTLALVRHPAIKAGDAFNQLLVVARGYRYEVYVNGIAVCEPFTTEYVKMPAQLGVGAYSLDNKTSMAEFTRMTIWTSDGLPTLEEQAKAVGGR